MDLRGWRLTDDAAQPAKWVFPAKSLAAGQVLLVWASGKDRRDADEPLHANFKLSAGGEYLALVRPDGTVAHEFAPAFPAQVPDVSYGRLAGGALAYFATPTPGAANGAGSAVPGPVIRSVTSPSEPPAVGGSTLVADSRVEFSGVQGAHGWHYGYQEGNAAYTAASFTECAGGEGHGAWNGTTQQWNGTAWAWAATSAMAAALQTPTDATPGPQRFPVRRWVSDVAGQHTIVGSFQSLDGAGDGVLGRVHLNGTLIHIVLADGKTKSFSLTVPLQPGDAVDFVVTSGPLDDDTHDATALTAQVFAGAAPGTGVAFPVVAEVQSVLAPVTAVTLKHRVMFGAEQSLPMSDDGTGADAVAGDGLWTAQVAVNALPGQMIRWRVEATDSASRTSTSPAYANPADSARYFGTVVADPAVLDSRLPVLHWFVETPSAANTAAGTRGAMYFLGNFYDNVLTTLHGQSSASFPKKSYNVDFTGDARFLWKAGERRVKDVNLISNWGDKSKVRHTLAYEWCARAGDPAFFAEVVRLQQNGAFFSTADMIEEGDDRFLERVGMDPDAALYKIYDRLENASTAVKQTRKTESNADLADLIAKLGQSNPAKLLWGWDNVDIPGTINYLVTMDLINNRDQGHKNFYMVRDTNGTRTWRPISWDNDLSWGRNYSGTLGYANDPFTNNSVPGGQTNRLKTLIFDNPELNRMYWRRLRSVMDALLQPVGTPDAVVEARIAEKLALIDPPGVVSDAQLDYAKWGSWGDMLSIRPAAARIVSEHLPSRRAQIFGLASLPASQSAPSPVTLAVGEVNPAGGQSGEYFTVSHATAADVDVSGWRVSGAVDFEFAAGTVIPPGRTLHVAKDPAGFRARSTSPKGGESRYVVGGYSGQLSARGETLVLADAGGTVIDTLTYPGTPSATQVALRITEIMYHPTDPTPAELAAMPWATPSDFEWVELRNTGATALDLGGAAFDRGIEFVFPAGFTLAAGESAVLVNDAAAFALRHPGTAVAGEFGGSLDNGGETLRLLDPTGEVVLEFAYSDAWHPLTDGAGRSLVVKDALAPHTDWGKARHWGLSLLPGGAPGQPDPAVGTTFGAWRRERFTDAEEADDAVSGPLADVDSDGLPSLLEYALAADPKTPSPAAWPVPGTVVENGDAFPTLTFRRPTGTLDLLTTVEGSESLQHWDLEAWTVSATTSHADGTETVTLRRPEPLAPGEAPFFRLRVSLEP